MQQLFTHINGLSYNEEGRFYQVGEENFLSAIIDSTTYPLKIRFGITRKGGLPLVEENGPPQPLQLAENAGLYEPIHAIVFENGIIGAEYNHFAPRLPKLSEYLLSKFPNYIDNVEIAPLMKPGVESQIARMGEVKVLRLKLNKDIISYARDLDTNLFDAFNAMRAINNQIEDVEIVLRAKPKHSFNLDDVKRNVSRWLRNSEVQRGVETFRLRAIDMDLCGARDFDLLQNYIRADKQVVQLDPRYRCVNTNSMYSKIIESYNELRPDIDRILTAG